MKEFIDKLIERLEEEENDAKCMWDNDEFYTGVANAFGSAISIVNELAEEYKGGWISVNERLPEIGQCVFVQVRYTQQLDTEDETPIQIRKYETKHERYSWKQIGYDEWLMDEVVIAWMPLPTPYTENKVSEMSTDWQQNIVGRFERVE